MALSFPNDFAAVESDQVDGKINVLQFVKLNCEKLFSLKPVWINRDISLSGECDVSGLLAII